MNKFLKEFKDRGFFYQCTSEDELSKQLDEENIKGYIGFDCTAESLHVGSLLQIMCLRLLQKKWASTNSFTWWRNYKNWGSIW